MHVQNTTSVEMYEQDDPRQTGVKGSRRYVLSGENLNHFPGARKCNYCAKPNNDDYYTVLNVFNAETNARLTNSNGDGASMFVHSACAERLLDPPALASTSETSF
jgi:hypothetical protein